MLSAGSPVRGSVIATRLRHVSTAQVRMRVASTAPALPRRYAGAPTARGGAPAYADALARPAVRPTAAAAVAPTSSWRRDGVGRDRVGRETGEGVAMMVPIFRGGVGSLDPGGGDSLDE